MSRIITFVLLTVFLDAAAREAAQAKRLRGIGEPCDDGEDELMRCADGLVCAQKSTMAGTKRRCKEAIAFDGTDGEGELDWNPERCLHAKCPVIFPDCPADSVPVLSTGPIGTDSDHDQECCPPALVHCRCDPQKCLVPFCPEGTERILSQKGTDNPGQCCEQYNCRPSVPNCQGVECPDPGAMFLDVHSPDGKSCPEDSFRPAPYIPEGQCCPIIAQCQCRLGICKPAQKCPDGQRLLIEKRGKGEPGNCCDQYECVPNEGDDKKLTTGGGCHHEGSVYAKGERWQTAACQECQCNANGVALCRRMECPALNAGCQWIGFSQGECCPVCLGCRNEESQTYAVGEHWARDGCTNCTCGADFRWQCQKFICQTNCENPRSVPGECCPVCDSPTIVMEPAASCPQLADCPLRCADGLRQDPWTGCFQCQCANGTLALEGRENCEPLSRENCPKMCAHGYLRDEEYGCAKCKCAHCPPIGACGKQCLHGFETNWMGCPICKCRGNLQAITVLSTEQTPNPMRCTPESSQHRDMGEWWTENCRQCFCHQGKEFCSLLACPSRPADCAEEHWVRQKDDCCPRCALDSSLSLTTASVGQQPSSGAQQVCHSPGTGQLFVDGQTWHLPMGDRHGCLGCTCRMGHVLCLWNDGHKCPPTPCENPTFDPTIDKCCPRCPIESIPSASSIVENTVATKCKDNRTNIEYSTGNQWRVDECQSCRCEQYGILQCHRERCPSLEEHCPHGRWLSLKDKCCPICSDALADTATCIYDGHVYAPGEQFQDGPCRNCTCLPGGLLKCLEIHCPQCSTISNGIGKEKILTNECCSCDEGISEQEQLLFSSFEGGPEQTVFMRDPIDKTNEDKGTSFWLLLGLGVPLLAFLLFAIGIGCLVVKCRRQKAKWAAGIGIEKNALTANGNAQKQIRWHFKFPNHFRSSTTSARRNHAPKRTSSADLEKARRRDIDAANVSLLRLREEKLTRNGG